MSICKSDSFTVFVRPCQCLIDFTTLEETLSLGQPSGKRFKVSWLAVCAVLEKPTMGQKKLRADFTDL